MTGITGHEIRATGSSQISLSIHSGSNTVTFNMVVCCNNILKVNGILGRDFLKATGSIIYFGKDIINIFGQGVPILLDEEGDYAVNCNRGTLTLGS